MHSSIKNTDLEVESVCIQNFDQEFGVAKVILFPLSSHIFQAMILSGGQFLPFLSPPGEHLAVNILVINLQMGKPAIGI